MRAHRTSATRNGAGGAGTDRGGTGRAEASRGGARRTGTGLGETGRTAADARAVRGVLAAAAGVGLLVAAVVGWVLADGAPLPGAALTAGRALLDGCAVVAVGLAVLGWLVRGGPRRDVEAAHAASTTAAIVTGGLWAAVALLLLWLQAAEVAAQPPLDVGVRTLAVYVGGFQPAAALLVTAAFALAYATAATIASRSAATRATATRSAASRSVAGRAAASGAVAGSAVAGSAVARSVPSGLPLVLAVGGLVPAPLTGHASAAPAHEVAVLSVALHATAAAVWVGGLGALLAIAAARRVLLAVALPRFSVLATAALATVATSGVLTAAVRLGSLPALVDTGYGRVVLAKAAVLATLGALALLVRRRVLPAARNHRAAPLIAFAGSELITMAVALGLAAALTRAAP